MGECVAVVVVFMPASPLFPTVVGPCPLHSTLDSTRLMSHVSCLKRFRVPCLIQFNSFFSNFSFSAIISNEKSLNQKREKRKKVAVQASEGWWRVRLFFLLEAPSRHPQLQ
jgi:hypothetical protein